MCVNKNAEYDVIANEIDALREKKAAVVTRDAEQEMLRKRIDECDNSCRCRQTELQSMMSRWSEGLLRRLRSLMTSLSLNSNPA